MDGKFTFCKSLDYKILYTIEIFYELHPWMPRCLVVWRILLLLLLLCCRLSFGISPWLFVIFTYHGITIKNEYIHTISYKLYLYMPRVLLFYWFNSRWQPWCDRYWNLRFYFQVLTGALHTVYHESRALLKKCTRYFFSTRHIKWKQLQ